MKLPKDSRLRRERNQNSREKILRKMNKKIASRKKLLMHYLKVISILLLKNISQEIIHPDVAVNAMNDKVSSISSKIGEQIEAIPEVLLFLIKLIWLTELIDSVICRRQEEQRKHYFLEKKRFHKIKNSPLTNTQKYLTNWWIALWSNRFTSFTRNYFISPNVHHVM